MPLPTLKPQQIPFDHPDSTCMFQPCSEKPFAATPAAFKAYGDAILPCLFELQELAWRHKGLDYVQVFTSPGKPEPLWFIEDGEAVTALLPSDY